MRKLVGVVVLILCGCASAQAQTHVNPFADIVARQEPTPAPSAPAPASGWLGWFQTKSQRAEQASGRGETCLAQRNTRCAVTAFSEAIAAQPSMAKYHYKLGVALGRAGVPDQAADEFRAALKLDPALPDARRCLALATRLIEDRKAEAAAAALAARFDR